MIVERPSVCTLDCPDTCSLTVSTEGDRIVKVRGSDALAWTGGVICNKVARESVRFAHGPQRLHVADHAVWRREPLHLLPVEATGPKPALLAPRPHGFGGLVPHRTPALLACPFVHEPRDDQRARRAPHDLVDVRFDIRADSLEQVLVGLLGRLA